MLNVGMVRYLHMHIVHNCTNVCVSVYVCYHASSYIPGLYYVQTEAIYSFLLYYYTLKNIFQTDNFLI